MSDNTEDLTHLILRQIQADLTALRGDVTELRGDVHAVRGDLNAHRDETRAEFAALRREMHAEFAAVRRELSERYSDLSVLYASAHAEHERRISDLETEVGRLQTPPIPKP
jgi:hypothetical protein